MSEKQLNELIEEIKTDEFGVGYIDCSNGTSYMDDNQYERIITAVKQNIELLQRNDELTKKLEEIERKEMDALNNTERLKTIIERSSKEIETFMNDLCIFLDDFKKIKYPLRIGDYLFEKFSEHVVYSYDPLQAPEPIKLEVLITENSDNNKKCPKCNKELGEYPAISRKDNKTEICSNCGMLEALEDFNKACKDKMNEQKEV